MRIAALCFLAGILICQQLTQLPPLWWTAALIPCLVLAGWPRWWLRWPAALAAGFLWTVLLAGWRLEAQLPGVFEQRDLEVTGRIAAMPQVARFGQRLLLDVEDLRYRGEPVTGPRRLRLSWFEAPGALWAGERWRLTVRLKRPHGFMNPGGFDLEGWLFRQGVAATGYVVEGARNERLAAARGGLENLRQQVRQRLDQALAGRPHSGIIQALAVGERQAIGDGQWAVLRATGTNHLVAISGLHVGMVAAAAFFLMGRLWTRLGHWPLRIPAPKAATVAALLAAAGYAALAGFALPTQRALIMLAVVGAGVLLNRQQSPSQVLAAALLLVLAYDPFAVMEAGFWLSFGAVAVIAYAMGGRPAMTRSLWWRWGRVQWVVAVGLTPVLLAYFAQTSLVSPLANLIAVPWVGVAVVPLTLLGTLLLGVWQAGGEMLLELAHQAWSWLWPLLAWLGGLDVAVWQRAPGAAWVGVAALVGVAWLLAPRGWPLRWAGAFWLLPLLWFRPATLEPGQVALSLLDVGQGLAALVRTRDHALVFDAGPRFGPGFDTGEAVVVPFMRQQGLERLDVLLVSHGDGDHVGGVDSLMRAYAPRRLLSSVPHRWPGQAEPCRGGTHWQWNGVTFRLLHPPPGAGLESENDNSCVLKVETAGAALLLTGDIERSAERMLLHDQAQGLTADVLVVPHHGSLTSSTQAFVNAVRPAYALFPVGYRNRFGFPKPAVVDRYRAVGAELIDVGRRGAVQLVLGAKGVTQGPTGYRDIAARYWHDRAAPRATLPGFLFEEDAG